MAALIALVLFIVGVIIFLTGIAVGAKMKMEYLFPRYEEAKKLLLEKDIDERLRPPYLEALKDRNETRECKTLH